jgi:hypothetical protein
MIIRETSVNGGIERWFETDSGYFGSCWEDIEGAAIFACIQRAGALVIAELWSDGLRFACS